MKRVLLLFAAVLALAACKDKENAPEAPQDASTNNSTNEQTSGGTEPSSVSFEDARFFSVTGTATVPNVEGENKDKPFVLENVKSEICLTDDKVLDIYLYQVSFSSSMPLTLDTMIIPGVTYTRSTNKMELSGNNIAPIWKGKAVAAYSVNNLIGILTATELSLTNSYGKYSDCTYVGKVNVMAKKK